jgi:hypothetical protein
MVASSSSLGALDHGAGVVLGQFGQHAARQLHRVALGQRGGHGAHGQGFGREGRDLQAQRGRVSALASAVATSVGVAAKVAGISSGWLAERLGPRPAAVGLEPLVDDALVRGVHVHHHQALGVFGQDVDAVQLRHGAAQRPVACGRQFPAAAASAVGDGAAAGPARGASCHSTATPPRRAARLPAGVQAGLRAWPACRAQNS